jgi:hypothetical protein
MIQNGGWDADYTTGAALSHADLPDVLCGGGAPADGPSP